MGTAGSKALLVGADGAVKASATTEYPMLTPQPLWAGQKPADWWAAMVNSIRRALDEGGVKPGQVAGVGVYHSVTAACDAAIRVTGRTELGPAVSVYAHYYPRYRALYPALAPEFEAMAQVVSKQLAAREEH